MRSFFKDRSRYIFLDFRFVNLAFLTKLNKLNVSFLTKNENFKTESDYKTQVNLNVFTKTLKLHIYLPLLIFMKKRKYKLNSLIINTNCFIESK